MNTFGHAAVAHWLYPQRHEVGMGAIAPDLAAMIRAQLPHPCPADLGEGVDLHHRTDRVFHALPAVRALMRELEARLLFATVRRGPSRATGHIGFELLLDATLLADDGVRRAYLAALSAVETVPTRDSSDAPAMAALIHRIRAHGVPDDLANVESVTTRIVRTLAHRPRLATEAWENPIIARCLADITAHVATQAEAIFAEVRRAVPATPST